MFTRTGLATLGLAVLAAVTGVVWGYPELVGLAAGVLVPLGFSLVGVRSAGGLVVHRVVTPERVMVGEPATSLLVVRNTGSRRSRRVHATERLGPTAVPLHISALDPGESAAPVAVPLSTDRRGVHAVGPLRFGRADPFGLTQGARNDTATATLVVYPRVHALQPLRAGNAQDMDGPTTDHSREGGIAFHGLRRYVPGDDVRLIHWRAVARSGTGDLVVRQHMETVRPQVALLIDTNPSNYPGDTFEVAMEVAASIASASIAAMHPITFTTTSGLSGAEAGSEGRGEAVLDQLAALQPADSEPLAAAVSSMVVHEPGCSLVIVCGDQEDATLAGAAEHARRFAQVVAVRTVPDARVGDVTDLGGVVALSVSSGETFARLWNEQLA